MHVGLMTPTPCRMLRLDRVLGEESLQHPFVCPFVAPGGLLARARLRAPSAPVTTDRDIDWIDRMARRRAGKTLRRPQRPCRAPSSQDISERASCSLALQPSTPQSISPGEMSCTLS